MKVKNFYNYGSYNEIHSNEVVNLTIEGGKTKINGKDIEEFTKSIEQQAIDKKVDISKSRGRKPECLFKRKDGGKDEEKTKMKASHFINYLKEQGIFAITIDTSRDNEVNKAFVSFYKKWVVEDEIPSYPNGNACFRFLKEDCELNMTSGDSNYMKTYGEFIRKMILGV